MTKEEIEAILTSERRAFIVECVRRGLADYDDRTNYSDKARRDHNVSLRATIRNAHIVGEATRASMDSPELGIRAVIRKGRPLFFVEDKLRVWFKKFTKNLRVRGIPTRQAREFLTQTLWPEGDMPQPVVNVIAGYVPDTTETLFEIWLVCPDGDQNKWEMKLSGAEIVELFPAADAESGVDEATERPKRRVQIRRDVEPKEDTNESA